MNQEYWDQFARTGRVEDYLSYREKEVCKAKTEKYGDIFREVSAILELSA